MSKQSILAKAVVVGCAMAVACASAFAAPQGERFIVQFKDGRGNAGKSAVQAAGASVALDLKRHNAVAAHIPAHALQGLISNPNVEYVEDDVKRFPLSTQREEDGDVPYGIEMVQALDVPEVMNGLKTVCIIDSGLDRGHSEFVGQSNIAGTSDSGTGDWFTDENGHGTHVAGTIAAVANGTGVVGVNSSGTLNLHIIKVFSAEGWAYSSGLVAALDACESAGADVVSMSLGGSFKSRTEDKAFGRAFDRGILSIAAAGNDGNTRKSYPASYDSVMSVAAVDAAGNIASFSQQNDQVEIAAPGVSVLSSVPRGTGSNTSVTVDGTGYGANPMEGSPNGSATGNLVDCGLGTSACPGGGGQVCLIQRGDISFADKVLACEAGGGVAAVIYNNVAGALFGTLGETATSIPSVGVSDTDGAAMAGGSSATVTIEVDDYAFFDGTSMATPHVSGVAGLVWNNFSDCGAADIRNALNATADDLGPAGRDNAYGHGLVQAKAAADYLTANGCGGSGGGGGEPPQQCAFDTGPQLGSGESCSSDSECCSGKCKGKPGSQTCN